MVTRSQSDLLEIELIRSLFDSWVPPVIMTACFLIAGGLTVAVTQDRVLLGLLAAGTAASLARLLMAWRCWGRIARPDLSIEEARELQRYFTMAYLTFAITLGLFGDQAMRIARPEVHMLTVCLLMGYGAGVAHSVGLRPRIAIPSMTVAILPGTVAALSQPDVIYWATSLLIVAFLAGGIGSVRARYRRALVSIGRRITFSTLAREDTLTHLPNRLALREWFDERIAFGGAADMMIAVHYLDLNGFKPVNDTYGHPVGDALLAAVGQRIDRTVRQTDLAARLGGDEFAVVQYGIADEEEAELLAQRLYEAISAPYQIHDKRIAISTCIGYVISNDRGEDLEYLLSLADEALYATKRGERRIMSHAHLRELAARVAA